MCNKVTIIRNPSGLHARPASVFVDCAKRFKSQIQIKKLSDNRQVQANSLVMLLTLGLGLGESVEIIAVGEDETAAVDTLVSLIDSGFDEN